MKHFFITIILLVLLSTSCSEKEQLVLASGNFNLSIVANLPEMQQVDGIMENPEAKAIAQYTVRTQWKVGDKISVVNLTTSKLLGGYLTANSAGSSTTFSGSVSGTINTGDRIAYLYPAQENANEINFTHILVDLSNQKGTINDVPLCVTGITTVNGTSFQDAKLSFNYQMCFMLIAMSDIPSEASIQSVRLTNVTNAIDLQINDGRTGFDTTPIQGDIVLTPDNTANSAGARTVYMAIPASPKVSSRRIILETGSNSFEASFGANAINNGIAYNTNVTGFLVDDIFFKDALLRTYCITYFDKNGDGKLSMVEIASASLFPSALPSNIICFDELEFFYGLTSLPFFTNQKNLTSITIPKQITSLQDGLFSGCSSLAIITLNSITPPSLGEGALLGTPDNQIIVVPDEAVDAYVSAIGWSDYATRIRGASTIGKSSVRIYTDDEVMNSENMNVQF